MKCVVLPEQMREIDRKTVAQHHINSLVLMENAARAVVQQVEKLKPENVLIFCGTGNNGGDGYAVARWLHLLGIKVTVCYLDGKLSGDAEENRLAAQAFGVKMEKYSPDIAGYIANFDVVIDALLGTGLSRNVEGDYKECIELINGVRGKSFILSVDIPSGVCARSGKVLGEAVKAHQTVTFAYAKYGHLLYPGRELTGRLVIAEISTYREENLSARWVEKPDISPVFTNRKADTHKGDYGKIAVLGGTLSMEGSVQMTGLACLRTGAGLVTLGVPQSNYGNYGKQALELMVKPVGAFDGLGFNELDELLRDKDCIAFGPGCGRSENIKYILKHILQTYDIPIVIDADGLNALAEDLSVLVDGKNVVLTPHYGEMARLMGVDIKSIADDPVGNALKLAKKIGATVLLKGSTTVIASCDGRITFNTTGNPGMATAGSGDVLTGIISAIIGQGVDCYQAACIGACIHGLAGDKAAEETGEYSLTAQNIIQNLHYFCR